MKKIFNLFISLILLINIYACSGYKPIFSSSGLQFKIADYSIIGNKELGNQIYSKLYNVSRAHENTSEIKNIYVLINVSKNKNATIKNNAGKILAYKIDLSSTFIIKDFITGTQILNESFTFSSSYKVQDQYSETIKLENMSIENLVNKIYQELLIKLSENI